MGRSCYGVRRVEAATDLRDAKEESSLNRPVTAVAHGVCPRLTPGSGCQLIPQSLGICSVPTGLSIRPLVDLMGIDFQRVETLLWLPLAGFPQSVASSTDLPIVLHDRTREVRVGQSRN